MYAVIRTGGKQCRVEQGNVVRVESLDAQDGDTVTFDEVLLIADGDDVRVGEPLVDGASVRGTVVRNGRGKKVEIRTYKRRQNSNRRRGGHRQAFTAVKIDSIEG
jgi:large subunit ribosomal protein L21